MISNITYKLSTFSNYSFLSYNKNDVIKVLSVFDDPTLAPGTMQEIHFDGVVSQRMQFVAQNGLFVMVINSDRIDISLTSNEREGFSKAKIPEIVEELTKSMEKLFSVFEDRVSIPNRLAWNTSYVYFDISEDEKKLFRARFLKDLEFFENSRLDDTVIRYAGQREAIIENQLEKINVLATINSYVTDPGTEIEINGFRIDYDINTWQGNRLNRFHSPGIKEFVDKAVLLQNELNNEILP